MTTAAVGFEGRAILLRRLRYQIREAGDPSAPAVVLLHGLAGAGEEWEPLAGALARAGYRALAVDLPGHGGTPAPRFWPLTRFGAEETGADLVALLDALGVAEAHWVGYSMGGRIALVAALAHPDRVDTLTLESAGPGLADPVLRAERRRDDEALASAIEERGMEWFAESWARRPLFATQRSLPAAARDALAARRAGHDPAGIADSLRAAGQGAQPFVGDRLASFARPALLVSGALDAKFTAVAAAMQAALPDALHVAAPDAGHNVHVEQPSWFERTLLTHLRRRGRTAAPAAPSIP